MFGSVMRRDLTNVEEAFVSIAVQRLDERHRARAARRRWSIWPACSATLPAEVASHPHLSMLTGPGGRASR